MMTKYPDVPNTAPLAFRLSLKSPAIKAALRTNRCDLITSNITPALVALVVVVILPFSYFDSEWVQTIAMILTALATIYFVRLKTYSGFLNTRIQRNLAALQGEVEWPFAEQLASVASEIAKSKYGFNEWQTEAEQHRNVDPFLYCAKVFTMKPELWDEVCQRVYKNLINTAPKS